ncbi:MAG: hypothetical protein JWM61_2778 [Micrococcaceae bacterium]|nr:hypothetical protein [Micrococcaceae bacterium]
MLAESTHELKNCILRRKAHTPILILVALPVQTPSHFFLLAKIVDPLRNIRSGILHWDGWKTHQSVRPTLKSSRAS